MTKLTKVFQQDISGLLNGPTIRLTDRRRIWNLLYCPPVRFDRVQHVFSDANPLTIQSTVCDACSSWTQRWKGRSSKWMLTMQLDPRIDSEKSAVEEARMFE